MKVKKLNRKFKPSKEFDIVINEKAKIYLQDNEQITLIDKFNNEYDIVKKPWGYYSTPSINKRLLKNNYHAYLVQNINNKTIFLFTVLKNKKEMMRKYIKKVGIKILKQIK